MIACVYFVQTVIFSSRPCVLSWLHRPEIINWEVAIPMFIFIRATSDYKYARYDILMLRRVMAEFNKPCVSFFTGFTLALLFL